MTQEELKELLFYDENVGVFMWKKPSKYKPQLLNKEAKSAYDIAAKKYFKDFAHE